MSLGEAQVPIRATLDKLDGDLNKARGKIDGAVKNLQKLGKFSLAGITAGVAALGAGVAIMGKQIMEGVDSLMRIERISAQTEAVIKSTGGAAGLTAQQITEMADSMEALTATEAESTQEAANMLLTFTSIGQDVFPDALQAVVDMGRAMDKTGEGAIDMSSQALMIGKALQDPIQGMTALRRVGVNFNESAVETVQAMVDIGDIAGAQKFILEELATEFGGSGEAFAQTTAGMRESMLHNLGSIQEALAGPFLTIAGTVFGRLSEIMSSPQVTEAISAITGAIENLMAQLQNGIDPITAIVGFLGQLIFAFGGTSEQVQGLNNAIWAVVNTIQGFIEQAQVILAPVMAAVAGFVSWQDVLIALGVAIAAVVLPIIWGLITAIAPVIAIFAVVVAATALLRNAWENNWGGIRDAVTQAWEGSIKPAIENLVSWLQVNIPAAINTVKQFWENTLLPALQAAKDYILTTVVPAISSMVDWLQKNIPAAIETVKQFWEGTLQPALQAIQAFIVDTVIPAVSSFVTWLSSNLTAAFSTVKSFWEGTLQPALQALWDFITGDVVPVIESFIGVLEEVANIGMTAIQGAWENVLKPALDSLWGFIQDSVVPILEELWGVMEEVGSFISATLSPVINTLVNGALAGLESAFNNIKTALSALKGLFDSFKAALSGFTLPAVLTPGSPTPFELGLRGISAAMREISDLRLPNLSMGLDDVALSISGSINGREPSINQSRSVNVENIWLPNVADGRGLLEELEEMTIG